MSVNKPELTNTELSALQPGLARLMPEIGQRMWKCYYAAKAQNWPLAAWQLREMQKLFRLGNVTRPKYSEDIETYLEKEIAALTKAIQQEDWTAFAPAFEAAVSRGNWYHAKWKKPYLLWKLPDQPPPDLELRPMNTNEP